jgi:hypothetical protein
MPQLYKLIAIYQSIKVQRPLSVASARAKLYQQQQRRRTRSARNGVDSEEDEQVCFGDMFAVRARVSRAQKS